MDAERVDIFMPLYVRDFLTATIGWSAEERGHYLTLLMVQWDRGWLPVEVELLNRITPGVASVWSMLEEKFPQGADGVRRNLRLESHRQRAVGIRSARSAAGKAGSRGRWGDGEQPDDGKQVANASVCHTDAMRLPLANQCHPEPEPEPHAEPESHAGNASRHHRHHPREGASQSHRPQQEDGWTGDVGGHWETLRERWNATPNVKPYEPLQFARADLLCDRLCDPAWLAQYPEALARIGAGLKFFRKPPTLLQFLGETFVADVLVGRFDDDWRDQPADRRRTVREGSL